MTPSARIPASSIADFSCPLATGRSYSIPVKSPPLNSNGASVLFSLPSISAPIIDNGLMILPIGRDLNESSPVIVQLNGRPASIPAIKRIVVPLLPASRTSFGSLKPFMPLPRTTNESPILGFSGNQRSISTPRNLRISTVDLQSSPGEKFVTFAEPLPIALNIAARCDTDLSPGDTTSPRRRLGLWIVIFISTSN